jgi:hypothetical protein
MNSRFNLANWSNMLDGETAFILGNAPSLIKQDLTLLEGRFTIGINRCFKAIDPTVLIWQDRGMYANDGLTAIRQTQAVKVCRDIIDDHKEFSTFTLQRGHFSFDVKPNNLKGFGCTGALAAQLAVSMGAGAIVLLGCDGKYGDTTDFYGDNRDHQRHTLANFRRAYHFIKNRCPVNVYNCSENKLWPQLELCDAIGKLKTPKKTRIQWLSRFLSSETKN